MFRLETPTCYQKVIYIIFNTWNPPIIWVLVSALDMTTIFTPIIDHSSPYCHQVFTAYHHIWPFHAPSRSARPFWSWSTEVPMATEWREWNLINNKMPPNRVTHHLMISTTSYCTYSLHQLMYFWSLLKQPYFLDTERILAGLNPPKWRRSRSLGLLSVPSEKMVITEL